MATATFDLGLVKGSTFYAGTAVSGKSSTGTAFPSSGITYALIGDMYFNTSEGSFYRCVAAGEPDDAKWGHLADVKGDDLTVSGVVAGEGLTESTSEGVKTLSVSMPAIRDKLFPVGTVFMTKGGPSPASVVGGTWTARTDTHLFLGYTIYERTA